MTHHVSDGPHVFQQVSVCHELRDEVERLRRDHTPNHPHHMRVTTLRYLLHQVNLVQEICLVQPVSISWSLIQACKSTGLSCEKVGGGVEREEDGAGEKMEEGEKDGEGEKGERGG